MYDFAEFYFYDFYCMIKNFPKMFANSRPKCVDTFRSVGWSVGWEVGR